MAKTRSLKTGDPSSENSDLGALVSAEHRDRVMSYIDKAKQLGGRILCGGTKPNLTGEFVNGYFIVPTIIEGLEQDCEVIQQEIFGPVVTLQSFKCEQEALKMANDVRYGLSASIWTSDSSRSHRFAAGLKAGIIWVNTWLKEILRHHLADTKLVVWVEKVAIILLIFTPNLKTYVLLLSKQPGDSMAVEKGLITKDF